MEYRLIKTLRGNYGYIYERISELKEEQLDYLIIDDINNITYKTEELKDCYERI